WDDGDFEHGIDDGSHAAAARVEYQRPRLGRDRRFGELDTPPQVDHGDHLAAVLGHAFDPLGHVGHAVRRRVAQHAVPGQSVRGEQVHAELKDDEFDADDFVALHVFPPGAASTPSSNASTSSTPINSDPRRTSPTSAPSAPSLPGTPFNSASAIVSASYTSST